MSVTYTGGHSIPYALTMDEMLDFFSRNAGNATLQSYLSTCDPPYGVIVQEAYGTLLVWMDQTGTCSVIDEHWHVIDVTNMSIATQVQQAPYQSPDSSFIQNLLHDLAALIAGLKPTINYALIAGIVIGGYFLMSEINRRRA